MYQFSLQVADLLMYIFIIDRKDFYITEFEKQICLKTDGGRYFVDSQQIAIKRQSYNFALPLKIDLLL